MDKKEENLVLNRWEMEKGLERLKSFPPSINLALTNRCNLSCIMCGQSRGDDLELSDEVLRKTEDLFPFLYDINLTGGGKKFLVSTLFRYSRSYKEAQCIFDHIDKRTLDR
jgi:MoaA/NifB/PqqE/SkfB family radical SAM enzyme